ncbi:NAD(P)H-hydrate dehydratase [Roseiconus nitratireducens]|uniref:ADP-dependent (S)-NAD(P)H-hydrate dehydratase n=1 Tax=Roseiconus nitratireducens TaxID=2605748 RepID=A0A5M6DA49_9BACT|nr:NAD(P)H-hydrate dehydratase [Roseiconus nitratireducens]KAA5544438.1 NAD(P)H-hydrate dehydratase [Roseiconus nitratireducens]
MKSTQAPLPFPGRQSDSHKGDFGRVVLIGGSRGMAGSISLSSMAALHTGSGLVTAVVPDRCLETVAGFHPGIMTLPLPATPAGEFAQTTGGVPDMIESVVASNATVAKADAIGCGPGMGTGAGSVRIVRWLLEQTDRCRVFDADAINIIAQHRFLDRPPLPRRQASVVLTPHPGELARLTGVSPSDRPGQIEAAETLVRRHAFTIVLKGGPTEVLGPVDPSEEAGTCQRHTNTTGNPGMATAGSGDVLTGMMTSLLGQGLGPWDAARLAVYVHGLAGDLAAKAHSQPAMTCVELLGRIGDAIATTED